MVYLSQLGAVLRDAPAAPFFVASPASPDGYPSVNGIEDYVPTGDQGLANGDRAISFGGFDLRGVGPIAWLTVVSRVRSAERVEVTIERAGERRQILIPLRPLHWRGVVISPACVLAAFFLFLRARSNRMARAYALAIGNAGLYLALPDVGSAPLVWLEVFLHPIVAGAGIPLFLRLAILFPSGKPPKGRWVTAWPWIFAVQGLFNMSAGMGFPLPMNVGERLTFPTLSAGLTAVLLIGAYRYRKGDPIERRQQKWVAFGLYCAVAPTIAAAFLVVREPSLEVLYEVTTLAWLSLPICVLISILRFNLFDIDRVLSATASYNVVLILALGGILVLVPRLSDFLASSFGLDAATGQMGLSVLIAGLAVPAQARLRPHVERLFFPERHALKNGIDGLLAGISTAATPEELTTLAGAHIDRLLRPETCAIYARNNLQYVPVFVRGRAVPPVIEGDTDTIERLIESATPVAAASLLKAHAGAKTDLGQAVLQALGAELIVPMRRGDLVVALLCLGPKRSGDVYTSTDRSLLAAIAARVSSDLLRFDQDELVRRAEKMRESLRRYVPGAVAARIAQGVELGAAEREVTVLFVDIRGYTSLSEGLRPEEVFSTVSEYTHRVSAVVENHGGCIVEFNGDGLMAVFGAPADLPEKERAAVKAGREIIEAVRSLRAPNRDQEISVGVGIATGPAFVGSVRAVDRMIWSALGSTTNLAARLQSLSRELDAAIVIDDVTYHAARDVASHFELHAETPIRGRAKIENVYALPLGARTAA